MNYRIATLVLFTFLFVGAGTSGFAEGVPDTLQKAGDPGGAPAWLSEEAMRAAMDAKGQPVGSRLRSVGHLFDYWEGLSLDLDEYARSKTSEIAPDGTLASCDPQVVSFYFGEKAEDLERLYEMATDVTSVRVVDSKPGFRFGQAGELLEVEVLSILKDSGAAGVPQDGFFLFDRYARMVIDGKPLCLGDRQVPRGEFTLFQIHTDFPADSALPTFFMDNSALVSADGAFYGALLDATADPDALAQELSKIGQFQRSEGQR